MSWMDQLNSGLIEVAVVRTPLPTESYQCHFLEAEPMMAVGKPEFFPDPAANSISVASLASCPLIVYRRWEPLSATAFLALPRITFCINDDARTSMTWAQCGAGIALCAFFHGKSRGRRLIKNPPERSGGHEPDRADRQKTRYGQPGIQRIFPVFSKLLCELGCYVPVGTCSAPTEAEQRCESAKHVAIP